MASGINKPLDRIRKSFADEAPALFLRLLGFVPVGTEADIQPLRPETAPTVVLPDYVAVVRVGGGLPIIFHAEFQAKYYLDLPRDMARYGGSLAWQYQISVMSALVMVRPQGVPTEIPELGIYSIGPTHTLHPFKVVRLRELDPAPVLETNNPRLLPWAVLIRSTDRQVREIATMVVRQGDDEALGRFITLAGTRYDRNSIDDMIGGGKMGFIRAILDASILVQEERDEAAAQGMAKGKAEEARRFLRLLLRRSFPQLESLPEIEEISNVETLESLGERILDADGVDEVRAAIVAVARPN